MTVERNWFWFWFWLASVVTLVLVLRQSSENRSNRQEHVQVLNQKSPKVIDRFVFNYLAVDNADQTADNKHTGSMIFPFFLLASKTDKPLGDDTFQN